MFKKTLDSKEMKLLKSNALKVIILEIICILFAIVPILFGIKCNEYLISVFLIMLFIISLFLLGFERDRLIKSRKTIIAVILITISLLFITYSIGFLTGFVRSPYNRKIFGIILNILPTVLLVISSELLRYQFCKKGNTIGFILSVIVFVLIDIIFNLNYYNSLDKRGVLEFICVVVLPSISKNVVMSIFSKKYGYKITIIYTLIMSIYEYIAPIMPNYDSYLKSIISIVLPIINMQFINYYLAKREKKDVRNKNYGSKIFVTLCVLFLIFLTGIYSNLFRYWVATIASGSMSPTIEVGDIVVVDKWYADNPQELEIGDILVFKVLNTLYTHRIINITEKNNNYYIRTKGDYKDNAEDTWIVTKSDIVGKVIYRIKYLGLPSIWLHNLIKGE